MSKGGKQVQFKVPQSKLAPAADAWIANRGAEQASDREGGGGPVLQVVEAPAPEPAAKEKMIRFTFEVPESLHRRIKTQCAARGLKMTDLMRDFLGREFPEA